MNLPGYLDRIGYRGPVAPTAEVLRDIHRAHLLAIPYENLDIHLGRELSLDPARSYRKLVDERRGGWCYEMNGLLGWALEEIGFRVRLLSGAVGRAARGPGAEGNHLLLAVELEQPWIADVGFGDGILEPVPLATGPFRQAGFAFELDRVDDRWRFRNHPWGGAAEFDFTTEARQRDDFAARCHELQTSPESGFVRTTVCQRWTEQGEIVSLRGATFRRIGPAGRTVDRVLTGREDYERVLAIEFGLDPRELGALWPGVWTRHLEWEREQSRLPASP